MNLSQIRTTFLAILNRNDCTTDLANQFITMAQTRIERTLRVPGMEKMSITTGDPLVPTNQLVIPSDFLELKYLFTPNEWGSQTLMEHKDIYHFFNLQGKPLGTTPRYYSRVGASYQITPVLPSGQTATMVYYGSQPSLLVDTDENFFSDVASDLLIYAALSYACDYFVDDRTASFESRYGQLYGDLETQGQQTDMGQSAMAMAPAYNMDY